MITVFRNILYYTTAIFEQDIIFFKYYNKKL